MRKFLILLLVATLLLGASSLALAETREHGNKKLSFGADFHKPWAGVSLNYMKIVWDAKGIKTLQYQITAWKSVVKLVDVYFVIDNKVVYKRSSEKALNFDLSYFNSTQKNAMDNEFFPTPVAPGFNYKNGEVWWVMEFTNTDTGALEKVVAVWQMKDNNISWKFLKDTETPKAEEPKPVEPKAEETPAAATPVEEPAE